jgi:hypothetical protein
MAISVSLVAIYVTVETERVISDLSASETFRVLAILLHAGLVASVSAVALEASGLTRSFSPAKGVGGEGDNHSIVVI